MSSSASKKRKGAVSSSVPTTEIRHPFLQVPLGPQVELYQILRARTLSVGYCIDWATLEQIQMADATVMTNFDDPGIVQFLLGALVHQLSVLEFEIALRLYTEEFMDDNDVNTLHRHIHYSPSKCWWDLIPAPATYDPSRSKASALPTFLRYLHAILAHTLIGRRESTGVVTTHDAYFL
ncbi:hypothetical protein PVK06_020907 [Gossypium arboreum]|uniref:Uncharacterized protein n=1 Tax=Gossypium arboreum TaxID=29729 RepID=A0ABR0PP97_GOSAR|nr:hypothetical protein PVK06_020907 [Gossypium arboreum]